VGTTPTTTPGAGSAGDVDAQVAQLSGVSRRALFVWTAAGVALVAALSAVVGCVGGHYGFDWTLASVFGTALGTTLLAAATGALAYSTWSDVRATWQLADLTRLDQESRIRPTVLLLSVEVAGGSDAHANVRLRNVGLGPALRLMIAGMYIHPVTGQPTPVGGARPAIGVDEEVVVAIPVNVPNPPAGGVNVDHVQVGGTYKDRSLERLYPIIDARGWRNDFP
jgi:hypothetical protein